MPSLTEYIRIPAKSPFFDHDWQRNGYMEDAVKLAVKWCEAHRVNGMDAGGGAVAGTDAAPVHRDRGHAAGYRAHVRPPRQAAGVLGLARGSRAVEAGRRKRAALRARRRGRWLRAVRFPGCADCAARPAHGASALCRAHRVLRGERQLRLAGLHRRALETHRQSGAGRLPRFRLRQLRPALGDHQPAWIAGRDADGRDVGARCALRGRRRRGALHVSHRAAAAIAHSRTQPLAKSSRRNCTYPYPRTASNRHTLPRACSDVTCTTNSRSRTERSLCPTSRRNWC